LPGQDWTREIPRALQQSDFILIFFSRNSVAKHGYVQREMKLALDAFQELPEGTIHTIPVRLDDCEVPASFQHYHYANLFVPNGFDHIVRAIRAEIAQRSGPTLPPSPQPFPRPMDAVPPQEDATTTPVSARDRPEVHRHTTSNAHVIPRWSQRHKRPLVLVGGVLLCGLITALYLVLSGQMPHSRPPELGASSELLVGTWRFTGVELGQPMDILWQLRPDGTATYIVNGVPRGTGTWRYRDAHIYEQYPGGGQGEGAIQILDRDHFVVTIVDNGVPAQTGVRLLYVRQ
jgi:TIR domain